FRSTGAGGEPRPCRVDPAVRRLDAARRPRPAPGLPPAQGAGAGAVTPVLLTAALGGGLVALALIAPWLLRQASPALVRVPRLAVVVLGAGVVGWLGALLALGPVLAWARRGPALLP